jgi:hypothetical protein
LRARGCTPEQVLDLGQGRLFNHSS